MASAAALTIVAYGTAFLLRFEFAVPEEFLSVLISTLPVILVIRVAFSRLFRLTLVRWRFVGIHDIQRLLLATTAGSVLFAGLVLGAPRLGFAFLGESLSAGMPRSVVALEWALTLLLTAGAWISYRTLHEFRSRARAPEWLDGANDRRVILVGAGEAGNLLAREIARSPSGITLVAVVDDDPLRVGTLLQGVRVMGTTADLSRIASETAADEIILAIPSATPERIREILTRCEALDLSFKVLPRLQDVIQGTVRIRQLRPLQIEDLLGRDPVRLDLPELAADLAGAVVIVTGAAGSIGSELARQVAVNGPGHLILLDHAETPLFFLERELRARFPELRITAVVGDVLDSSLLASVFRTHGPARVYHAAAYKHVRMMEGSPRTALLNNALGSWRVAEAAGVHRALTFVLISTDKAVRPTSVMGASKRLAELLVQGAQARFPETTYRTVRFGNVLGSNGSVVPIFAQQLKDGKPLTVTHPEVTRYFMTIPEAVQLVLQASLLPEAAGRISMLEMGAPVKILDLARKMIRLSGVDPARAEIVFTGLTPGEKLHEELAAPEETPEPTGHPKVQLVGGRPTLPQDLAGVVRALEALREDVLASDPEAQTSQVPASDGSAAADALLWGVLKQWGVTVGTPEVGPGSHRS
jgi:FlaA1/EpsC-like NDP-sugar epimerase